MAVMGDLLDKILIPLRPQSAPVRNDHRDSISEEKCDAGWIHSFISDQANVKNFIEFSQGGEVVTVPTTPEKAKKEGNHSKISGEKITRPWDIYLEENKGKWKELSIKGDTNFSNLHFALQLKKSVQSIQIVFFLLTFQDQQRRQEEAKLKPED